MPFQPILFIGAGSQGSKILSRIHENMSKANDPLVRDFYAYLNITSEVAAEKGVSENDIPRVSMTSSGLTTDAVMKRLAGISDDPNNLTAWWPREGESLWRPAVQNVETGAGGVRCIGRALFQYNEANGHDTLYQRIRSIKNGLRDRHDAMPDDRKADVANDRLICFVFGSVAGGTFSGCISDIAAIVRAALASDAGLFGQAYLAGVFLLADTCQLEPVDWAQKKMQDDNTAHALAELYLSHCRYGRDAVANNWPRSLGAVKINPDHARAGYNSIVVIGAYNEAGRTFPNLPLYHQFVADYYSSLILSGEFRVNSARFVDQGGQIANMERKFPSVPAMFGRIGRLGIRPPVEKISAMLKAGVGEVIAHRFKNSDEEMDEKLLAEFESRIEWNALHAKMLPPDFSLDAEGYGDLADTRSEFEAEWKQRKQQLDAFYAGFAVRDTLDKSALPTDLSDYIEAAQGVIREISQNTLGFSDGQSFSLGSLAYFCKTIQNKIEERISSMETASADLQKTLFAGDGGSRSLTDQFNQQLSILAAEFPEKSINPFRSLQRKRWTGVDAINEDLKRYRDALRAYQGASRVLAILRQLRLEIQMVNVMVKLIGTTTGFPVVSRLRTGVDNLFDDDEKKPQVTKEIIRDREDIHRIFAAPMLVGADPKRTGETASHGAAGRALGSWISKPDYGLKAVWTKLFARLSEQIAAAQQRGIGGRLVVPSVEQLMLDDECMRSTDRLGEQLMAETLEHTASTFDPEVARISVWDALSRYVSDIVRKEMAQTAGNVAPARLAETILKRLFKQYAEDAKLFGRLEPGTVPSGEQPRDTLTVVGNAQDAEACFQQLGISKARFLDELINHGFGRGFTISTSVDDNRNDFSFFLQRFGDSPLDIINTKAAKELLVGLADASVEPNLMDDLQWTDRRYPSWISGWWSGSTPPKHLKDSFPG